ncbi:MAG: enoyl-CoA hydratase-related protein, partial [Actinomycetota bacterium]
TLNRPERLNALTSVMSDELVDAFEGVNAAGVSRAVVVTGAGRGFCAGQDLTEFEQAYRDGGRLDVKAHLDTSYHKLIPIIVNTPLPVIAAVNGVAAGAGLSLATACDLRLASDEARFTQAFVKIGLAPDSGGSYFLPRLIGYAKALELTMTGELVDAKTALDLGLVSRVFPAASFRENVADVAAELASLPTKAIGESKRLLREALELGLDVALDREADAQDRMVQTADHIEGVTAFVEKREPIFKGE